MYQIELSQALVIQAQTYSVDVRNPELLGTVESGELSCQSITRMADQQISYNSPASLEASTDVRNNSSYFGIFEGSMADDTQVDLNHQSFSRATRRRTALACSACRTRKSKVGTT